MNKEIFYNAPIGLYRGFLDNDESRQRVLNDVLDYAAYIEYISIKECKNEEERWNKVRENLSFTGGENETIRQRGESFWKLHSKEPHFSLNSKIYWRFRDAYNSDEECILLLAYLALKSICGKKRWAKTTNAMWLSRIDGKNRPEWKTVKGEKQLQLSKPVAKYKTNYGVRRIRALLFECYGVSFYTKHVRGFCFSTTLGMNELLMAIRSEQSESKRLDDKLKAAMMAAENTINKEVKNVAI